MIQELTQDLIDQISKIRLDIRYLALLGSYREGEAIKGYSDCDFIFIVKSDEFGNISNEDLENLKDIAIFLSKIYSVHISFLTHTEFDLREYVDFEYLKHYSWGSVILGDKDDYKLLFENILEERNTTDKKRKDLMYYNIIHARFNLLRKYVSINEHNTKNSDIEITKLFIDKIIEIIDWILIYDGYYFETKKEILKQFLIKYNDQNFNLNEILSTREMLGKDIEIDVLKKFNKKALGMVKDLAELVINKHKNDYN